MRISVPEDIAIDGILVAVRPREVLVEPLAFGTVPIGVLLVASARVYDAASIDRLRIQMKSLSIARNNAITHEQTGNWRPSIR